MTQEDKELLLKYLCMALPYGVKCHFKYGSAEDDITLGCIDNNVARFEYGWYGSFHVSIDANYIKPYLRSMSSMTEEEKHQWIKVLKDPEYSCSGDDWLIEHHFDIRHLIDKGLAIEVTESNNPYKE